ncbi:MAG TPA: hypothetical protein VGP73_11835 [Thermoanaerobaculia bacterium]
MADNYTIYLVNKSAGDQIFWCFLEQPVELKSQAGVFANSAASLAVVPNYPGENYFTIPAQFVVGAGASNNAVGLNVRVTSAITQNANLTDQFSAEYTTVPPNKGPNLTLTGNGGKPTEISIASNGFNQANNENLGWFSNMSFGINTANGFMGMTWSPFPSQTRTLTPTLKFYVAVGSYGANTLAAYTTVSNQSAQLTTPRDFLRNEATVTYTATGTWLVTPGKPKASLFAGAATTMDSLVDAHRYLARAHADLITLGGESAEQSRYLLSGSKEQEDTVVSVEWKDSSALGDEAAAALTFLVGTLTVGTALSAAFTYFVLSGVRFQITRAPVGGTTVDFTYSGTQSANAIKDLLTAGAQILLGRQ